MKLAERADAVRAARDGRAPQGARGLKLAAYLLWQSPRSVAPRKGRVD